MGLIYPTEPEPEPLICYRCHKYHVQYKEFCYKCFNKICEPKYHKKPYNKLITCDICLRNKHDITYPKKDIKICTHCLSKSDFTSVSNKAKIFRAMTDYYYKHNYIEFGEKELWRKYAYKRDYEKYNKYFLRCEDV